MVGAGSHERSERDVEAKTLLVGADSGERNEGDVGTTIQLDRRAVSEHVTPQSGRVLAFSTNC